MKNIYIASLVIFVCFALFSNYQGVLPEQSMKIKYLKYLEQYRKIIPQAQQFAYRLTIFTQKLQLIEKHNSNPDNQWKMGVNQFTDLTQQQFIITYLLEQAPQIEYTIQQEINAGFQNSIDWRDQNIVTSVKNQGKCGSCWAFAATAAHQSYQVQHNHQNQSISLSQQQLVDCSTDYDNAGCGGGLGSRALQYIKDFGQTTTQQYPYAAVNQDCKTTQGKYRIFGVSQITGCSQIQIVIQKRPMAVRVDASKWHLYGSGIFDDCDIKLNHAVFLIGSSQEAWTIKNSWDTTWGEKGYIRLKKGNTCGVCIGPSFPV